MNVLPCDIREGAAFFQDHLITLEGEMTQGTGIPQIGVRPEFVTLGDKGLPATVVKVSDVGRHAVVEAKIGDVSIKAVIAGEPPMQGAATHLAFDPAKTRLYRDGWIATRAGS